MKKRFVALGLRFAISVRPFKTSIPTGNTMETNKQNFFYRITYK